MKIRLFGLLIVIPLLYAASEPVPAPEPLKPYVNEEGRFEPGDYGWIRGAFDDATPAQKDNYRAITEWADECSTFAQQELHGKLAAVGFPNANLTRTPVGRRECYSFGQPFLQDKSSFAAFEEGIAEARPVIDTFLAALRIATTVSASYGSGPDVKPPSLARKLETRIVGDQMARMAFTWGSGMEPDSPQLGAIGRSIFLFRLTAVMAMLDEANTDWLKAIVAERGWPKISDVGEEASSKAWLLVQHADHDPLFQLEVLRLMDPLLEQNEVSKSNYAYLYDRVMLKLAGKQRYGTQVLCTDGVRRPLPLEDEAKINVHRAAMGLDPVDDYIAGMNEAIPCESLLENSIKPAPTS